MNLMDKLLWDNKTGKKLDYNKWFTDHHLDQLFGIDQSIDVELKVDKDINRSVDQNNNIPLAAELDDLTRLHFIATQRKACTIMEFGAGKSTLVFADALQRNKKLHADYVNKNLRKSNPFELFSIENSEKWMNECKKNLSAELASHVNFHYSEVEMTTFNGRACTMYKELPNICPDLIYLDGPDQFNISGDVRGISTRAVDRLPMAADILMFEHFLLPGTLIIVDGRTANARFLMNNLQRAWEYCHFEEEDMHAFELAEKPLGKINAMQLDFINGAN